MSWILPTTSCEYSMELLIQLHLENFIHLTWFSFFFFQLCYLIYSISSFSNAFCYKMLVYSFDVTILCAWI
jgi:hypothetical protein